MQHQYYIRQAILFLASCLYFIMGIFVPVAGGGVGLIVAVFAPISFAAGILMLLLQKLAHVYASARVQTILFYCFVLVQVGFALTTYPYRF